MRHIVWDWNGTLFADHHVVVEAFNAVLDDAGLPPVDLATYQSLYTRPVQRFYERLFGRPIDADEWRHIDDVFHDGYRAAMAAASLAPDAEAALDTITGSGRTQSLLSMYRHDELVPLVSAFGIDERFVRIDGLRGEGGGLKAPHLEDHLTACNGTVDPLDPREVVVIGDVLDDAAAAAHVGARCVLYDGGSVPRTDLERAGVPVADSLVGALELAGLG